MSIREDLIQEAVKSMWEKSGLLKETKKYSVNYQYYGPELHEQLFVKVEAADAIL